MNKKMCQKKKNIITFIIVIIAVVALSYYIKNVEGTNQIYDEIRGLITEKELKNEMFDDGEFSEILSSTEGKKIISEYLEYYKNNCDYESALHLYSVIPYSIAEDITTESFLEWIVDYGKHNGVYSVNKDPEYNFYYMEYYEVQDYCIIVGVAGSDYLTDCLSVVETPEEELQYNVSYEKGVKEDEFDWTFNEETECFYSGCDLKVTNGTRFCGRHLCNEDGCGASKSPLGSYCDAHKCLKCGNRKHENSSYCMEHKD